jgi:hypothetical protein
VERLGQAHQPYLLLLDYDRESVSTLAGKPLGKALFSNGVHREGTFTRQMTSDRKLKASIHQPHLLLIDYDRQLVSIPAGKTLGKTLFSNGVPRERILTGLRGTHLLLVDYDRQSVSISSGKTMGKTLSCN